MSEYWQIQENIPPSISINPHSSSAGDTSEFEDYLTEKLVLTEFMKKLKKLDHNCAPILDGRNSKKLNLI